MGGIEHRAWFKPLLSDSVVSSVPSHPLLAFFPLANQKSSTAQTGYF